ncbi:DUF3450 domain-containing protein [Modicisalibacter luteus]
MKQGLLRRSCRLSVVMLLMGACTLALAQNDVREESIEAQREQAELQEKIDAADEATREALRELRAAEREANRLRAYNAELAPLVERQSDAIVQREQALSTLSETREALPVLMRDMVDRLRRWVEADLPFLQEERLARVDELENMLADAEMSASDKLDRVLAAWRTELDYGREMDAWRGQLVGAENREVDYLRLGRVGWYYVAPDGSKGVSGKAVPTSGSRLTMSNWLRCARAYVLRESSVPQNCWLYRPRSRYLSAGRRKRKRHEVPRATDVWSAVLVTAGVSPKRRGPVRNRRQSAVPRSNLGNPARRPSSCRGTG